MTTAWKIPPTLKFKTPTTTSDTSDTGCPNPQIRFRVSHLIDQIQGVPITRSDTGCPNHQIRDRMSRPLDQIQGVQITRSDTGCPNHQIRYRESQPLDQIQNVAEKMCLYTLSPSPSVPLQVLGTVSLFFLLILQNTQNQQYVAFPSMKELCKPSLGYILLID